MFYIVLAITIQISDLNLAFQKHLITENEILLSGYLSVGVLTNKKSPPGLGRLFKKAF